MEIMEIVAYFGIGLVLACANAYISGRQGPSPEGEFMLFVVIWPLMLMLTALTSLQVYFSNLNQSREKQK